MTTVSGSFTGEGVSDHLLVRKAPQDLSYTISGTFTGKVYLERALTFAGLSWEVVKEFTGGVSNQSYRSDPMKRYRFRGAVLSGTANYSIQDGDALFGEIRNPQNVLVAARTEGGDYVVGDLRVDGTLTIGGVPITGDPATETEAGVVELATTAEAAAGTDTERAVTPAGLATYAPAASETAAGKVELATAAETLAGSDSARAVHPAGLASAVPGLVPDATASTKGKVELALDAEAITGTDTTRAVTPANLAAAVTTHVAAASTSASGKVELATDAEAIAGSDTARAVTPAALAATLATLTSPPLGKDGTVRSGSFNATKNLHIRVDTSGGTANATLPANASLSDNDRACFEDLAVNFGTNKCTLTAGSGSTINGVSAFDLDVSGCSCYIVYDKPNTNWVVVI